MPKLRVEIDIFSGRPNPVIELTEKESREALAQMSRLRPLEKGEPALPPGPTLGYRGLIVEQIGRPAAALPRAFRLADGVVSAERRLQVAPEATLEDLVRQPGVLGRAGVERALAGTIAGEIERFRKYRVKWPHRPVKRPHRLVRRCRCAPLYEPAWWNDGGQKQLRNNCYNYGSNYRTDTFRQIPGGSQPGAAAGAMYASLTGPAVSGRRTPRRTRHRAGHRLSLVPQGAQRAMDAQARNDARHRRGQQQRAHHRSSYGRSRDVYAVHDVHGRDARPHQDQVVPADCIATVSVYSGRPDPEWPLSARQAERLRRAWDRLKVELAEPPSTPVLGYRGIAMRCASGSEWRAYRGFVTYTSGDAVERRNDDGRRFERALLATAPGGVLPSGIPEIDGLVDA
jgi:hypothetical protein